MQDEIVIRIADTPELLTAAFELRNKVFCEEQGFSPAIEQDGKDDASEHVVAMAGDAIVGCGRIRQVGNFSKLERIAVDFSWRRAGIGRLLLQSMIEICRKRGDNIVKLSAQSRSLDFYVRCGFAAEGEEFEVEGVPHQMMSRNL